MVTHGLRVVLVGTSIALVAIVAPRGQETTSRKPSSTSRAFLGAVVDALAPVVVAPEEGVHEGDVMVRLLPPPGKKKNPVGYTIELSFWDAASGGWSTSVPAQLGAGADGSAEVALSSEWFDERSPAATRWRLRARTDESRALWSGWRVFGRGAASGMPATDRPAPEAAEETSENSPTESPSDTAAVVEGAESPAPRIIAPAPTLYDEDVPVHLSPPSGVTPASYVIELSFYDGSGRDWSAPLAQSVTTGDDGGANTVLARSWLTERSPAGARWRLRARTEQPTGAWSEWTMFAVRIAASSRATTRAPRR